MLGVDEIRNAIHWSRSIERNHSHDILNAGRFELLNILAHLRALKLKDPRGLAFGEQGKGFCTLHILLSSPRDIHWQLIKWQLLQVDLFASRSFDEFNCIVEDSQVGEAQEI